MKLSTSARTKLVDLLIADDFDYISRNREGDGVAVLKSLLRYGWKGFEGMSEEQLLMEAEGRGVEVPWTHSYL